MSDFDDPGTESDDISTRIESEDSDLKELFGHNGVFLTAGIIVADVVGAGILAMPVAIANFGLYPGIAALLLLLAANVHISVVMWRVRMFCPTSRSAQELIPDLFAVPLQKPLHGNDV